MGKPQKDRQNKNKNKEQGDKIFSQDQKNISSNVEQKIKEALTNLNKEDQKNLDEKLGKGEFSEQLRKYFEEKHPNLLDEIENKDQLKIYIDQLKNHGFTINNLTENAKSLDESFKESESEYNVTEKSLKKLRDYCEDEKSSLPGGIFDDFARFAKIETTPLAIETGSKIKKASDLKNQRNKFLEDQKIDLKPTQKDEMSKIMNPKYAPTTRLLVSGSIKKIQKSLPKNLQKSFESRFKLPISITSEIQNLNDLKNEWILFLQENHQEIDKDLAKKLDNIHVSNQDLYEEYENEGISYQKGKGFSEQEQEFKIIFNKLATRQLFDGINKSNSFVEMKIESIGDVFKGFPPYINDIFKIHAYDDAEVKRIDPTLSDDLSKFNEQLIKLESQVSDTELSSNQKNDIFDKIKKIKEQKNNRKWDAYAKYLSEKNPKIGNAIDALIKNGFDVSKLDKANQQLLLNDLVTQKLNKVFAEGTAESLNIDEDRFLELMNDFFDLNKKELTIPGPNGDIVFDCPEKTFLGGPLTRSLEMGSEGPILADAGKQNLPLNIKLRLTEDNKDFFEKSPIFEELFQKFEAKNGTQILNDGYQVRVKNSEGKEVTGYLSNYPPKGKDGEEAENMYKKNNNQESGTWYVYSKPITRPEDDRELLFRENDKPAIISENEENSFEIDIISREMNLNRNAIGALLFGTTVGQYAQENKLNSQQTKKLEETFEKLNKDDVYKDTLENKEKINDEQTKTENTLENKEKESDFDGCIKAWKALGGYQTIDTPKEKGEKPRYGFEKGAKIMMPFLKPSVLPPNKDSTTGFLTLEITDINTKKNTFEVKISGGETKIGKYEGIPKTLPLSEEGINRIKKTFGDEAYKLPKDTDKNPNNMISILEQAGFDDANPSKFFKNIERNGKSWVQTIGDKTEEIMYFGKTEVSPGEPMDGNSAIETLCKVEYNANKARPYTVYINDKDGEKIEKEKTDMDAINFALFIASKKLSPKTKTEVEEAKKKQEGGPNQALPPKKVPISISSLSSFMKSVSKKVSEGLKKYEEKQAEDLTETIMFEGKLMSKLAGIMPSDKMKFAFGKVGEEYLLERDGKVWKKIEDYIKYYESDPDFGGEKMRTTKIQPFLEGKIPFKDQRQAAGILMATIKKGKGPYSRNTDRAGKGMWIKILMGEAHQARYIKMKEKLEQELKEGININGQGWANDRQNEILKLEMKYITHVIDGRQLRSEDTPQLEMMFSKKFAGELEGLSNTFFKETASGAYNNTKDISFELARFEYFRLLGDRPQQAIANLKAVAEKAVTDSQWKVFESMVLTGMLSGVFNSMTQEDKKFIEKICRTAGFLPGLLIRQPNVHHKIAKLLDVATNGGFSKSDLKYNPSSFDFGKMESTGQIKSFVNYEKGFNSRYMKNEGLVKSFLSFEKNDDKKSKKLTEIYENPNTSNDIKQILGEIIGKRYETNEELDSDVKGNGKSLQQNILCRNQSLIDEIIRFQDGSFKGKDKDAVEDAKETRKKIAKKIPTEKGQGKTDVIFTLKMFSNRFEDKGFNSEQKKFLIRLLKTVKEETRNGNKEGAKEMLRYGIVGKIIRSSGSGQVPDELKSGLEKFKDFFENNLDTILSEEVINEGFGDAYVASLEKPAFKVAPWSDYVKIMEYNKFGYSADLSKEENQEQSRKKKEYGNPIVYINKTIYGIADELEKRDYGVPNTLKEMYDPEKDKKSTKKQLEEVLGKNAVALKNHDAIQRAERRKDGPGDGLTDEERALFMANEESGYPGY